MESTNLHHLQNQNHSSSSSSSSALHASSSSSSSYFGVASGTTTNITLNGDYKLKQNLQDTNYRSPRSRSANSMIEAGLGYNNNSNNSNNNNNEWASSTTNTGSCLSSESCEDGHDHYHLDLHHHHHHHQYNNNNYNSKMKEEISDNINVVSFPTKFTEMLNTTSTMDQKDFNALSDKLLYSAITSPNFSSSGVCGGMGNLGIIRGGSFTQIHPTVNISSFTQTTSSSSLPSFNDINNNMQCSLSESSDLFHGGLVITNHQDNHNHNHDADLFHPRFADSLSFRRLQHMQMQQQQQPIHTSSCIVSNSTNNPISEFTNGMVAEAKRPINTTLVESKASHQSQTVPKKSRLESRSSSSCPPFKVRKEKLGDRIAALQQLVAPFGKTDTASVLMEAIGYIKFLQNQVETLSVPYMKSSRKQNNRAMQGVSEGKQEEGKVDLRSRGLCLVPLSCMSYFTSDGGTGLMWQHSDHFGGPT